MEHATIAFTDQRPGTSGLRKKTKVFAEKHYLENFIQSIFAVNKSLSGGILVLGGDGRYYNDVALRIIMQMAKANGIAEVIAGKDGILSTPAASYLIRKFKAQGGIILSASHNPAGIDGDFGVKFNIDNGGPASETITDAIYKYSTTIISFLQDKSFTVDLNVTGEFEFPGIKVTVIDSVTEYGQYMQELFDFSQIGDLLNSSDFKFKFDAMHAVTGPYAEYIFEETLGGHDVVINGTPLSDFGGGHPDPNLIHAKELVAMAAGDSGVDFVAASDGDGDRNMILGKNIFVNPSDSLAFILANAEILPAYQGKVLGVARSMPTSRATDIVSKHLGIPCFETPTGWKFFGNLLDYDKITFCGEESFGTSSNHVREKDGLWAVLAWLNILAYKRQSVAELMLEHWRKFGRNFYVRYDYEEIAFDDATTLMTHINMSLPNLPGLKLGGKTVVAADNFSYKDPIDLSVSKNQGIRIICEAGARIVCRLSGTGTRDATLRVYFEMFSDNPNEYHLEPQDKMSNFIKESVALLAIEKYTGRRQPSVIT